MMQQVMPIMITSMVPLQSHPILARVLYVPGQRLAAKHEDRPNLTDDECASIQLQSAN